MSPELKQFYRDYLAWAEAGAGDHQAFNGRYGLCKCLRNWGRLKLLTEQECEGLHGEQEALWLAAGLDHVYPFNADDVSYAAETAGWTKHRNEQRLAWVREHAA